MQNLGRIISPGVDLAYLRTVISRVFFGFRVLKIGIFWVLATGAVFSWVVKIHTVFYSVLCFQQYSS